MAQGRAAPWESGRPPKKPEPVDDGPVVPTDDRPDVPIEARPGVPADAGLAAEDAGLESTHTALGFDETAEARRSRRVWRWVVSALFALLFLVAVAGAALWVTDYKVTADVEETRCDVSQVTVRTRQFGFEHTVQDVPLTQCLALEPGNFVEYRIRTQRTTLYEVEGGECIYDSVTGPC